MSSKVKKWGNVSFRIFELIIFKQCLENLRQLEQIINKKLKLSIQPLEEIEKMQGRIDEILEYYNLRNRYALERSRNITITPQEWKTLQNSLCITIGMEKEKEIEISPEILTHIKHMHRRFELFPIRISAGLKSRGKKINEEELARLSKWYKTHESETALKPLKIFQ